jgi:hypothetical protein
MEKTGSEGDSSWDSKYSMKQLLDPEFKLPLTKEREDMVDVFAGIEGIKYDEVK